MSQFSKFVFFITLSWPKTTKTRCLISFRIRAANWVFGAAQTVLFGVWSLQKRSWNRHSSALLNKLANTPWGQWVVHYTPGCAIVYYNLVCYTHVFAMLFKAFEMFWSRIVKTSSMVSRSCNKSQWSPAGKRKPQFIKMKFDWLTHQKASFRHNSCKTLC